jgi:hypothetical protein
MVPRHAAFLRAGAAFLIDVRPVERRIAAAPSLVWQPSVARPKRQFGKEASGMNRRAALFSTLLLGGLPLTKLSAQSRDNRRRYRDDRYRDDRYRDDLADRDLPRDDADTDDAVRRVRDDDPPADIPPEPGHVWRRFDISRYTDLPHANSLPQNAVVEWVFRRTGSSRWYGEKISVLSAGRNEIRAFHSPSVLKQVAEIVERFTNPISDYLSVGVRFVAAVDPSWRNLVYPRLNLIKTGPQGQQVWSLKVEDAAMVMTQMQVFQGFKLLANEKVEMINGQTLTITTTEKQFYTAGLRRTSGRIGSQPDTQQLMEGVVLKFSPLLNFDGDAIESAIELTANTVRSLHKTKVLAPREVGSNDVSIDVPEVSETRFNQTVSWPLGQTLLISAGIHPGILQTKNGFLGMRIPGTMPTNTELLVFLDATTVRPKRASRDRDRDRVRD